MPDVHNVSYFDYGFIQQIKKISNALICDDKAHKHFKLYWCSNCTVRSRVTSVYSAQFAVRNKINGIYRVYFVIHATQTYVYYWIKIDQLDVTCFIISLFNAQHVSNVTTSIFRSLRLIVDLFHVLYCSGSMCVGVTVWFGWGGVVTLCRLKH